MTYGVVIIAGGKGSRSENPTVPKVLQVLQEKKNLLDLYIENFPNSKEIHLFLGYENEQIVNYIRIHYPHLANKIYFHIEESAMGSGGALTTFDWRKSKCDNFVVLLGDVLLGFPESEILKHIKNAPSNYLFLHPNLHPYDSDRIRVNHRNEIVSFIPKLSEIEGPNLAIAGLYILTRDTLLQLPAGKYDLSIDLIPRLIENKSLKPVITRFYLKDIGTQDRIHKARKEISEKNFLNRSAVETPGIFIDRDNTLIPDIPLGRRSFSGTEIDMNLVELISHLNSVGIPIFLVTNQPAVAKGYIDLSEVEKVHNQISTFISKHNAFFDDIVYCPHHPDIGFKGEIAELKIECICRKPKIGMLQLLSKRHNIDLEKSIVLGDSEVDRDMANLAKAEFVMWKYADSNQNQINRVLELLGDRI